MLNFVCRCLGGDTGVSGQGVCGSFLVHLRLDLSDRRARVSALQHAATRCSTATHCTHCNQHTAQSCNTLFWMFGLFCLTTGRSAYTATNCITLQNTLHLTDNGGVPCQIPHVCVSLQHSAPHCNTLQRTALHCTLQLEGCHGSHTRMCFTATHRNTQQHAATYCNIL